MKFVILHGTSASHESNWFPWLKGELESLGHEVWVPDLPDADEPNIATWNQFLLSGEYDFKDSVLIGHSAGSVEICGLLQELDDSKKLKAAILVGTFRGDLGWDNLHGLNVPFDYDRIRQMAEKFIVLHSDNDPHCPLDGAEWVAKQLDAEMIVFPGMGHFSMSQDIRFSRLPELLEIIEREVL
jgi:predicted alpha/beta hydrolase family esterase